MKVKVQKLGVYSVIILPGKATKKFGLKEGDELTMEKEGAVIALRPVSDFQEWAEAYRQANIKYKDVLKDLSND